MTETKTVEQSKDLPRPRYAEKHVFGPQPEVSRGAIRRAYARAAEFCRLTPEIPRHVKVRIMRRALSQSESRLRNRFLADKKSWIAYGCPPELLPWEAVMYSQVVQCRNCGHRFYPESPRHGYQCRVCREGYVGD